MILHFVILYVTFLQGTKSNVHSGYESNFDDESEPLSQDCPVLYMLNVEPYPDDGEFAGWDRGLELIPGGDLAAEQINNRSDILMGRELSLINIDSEACGRSTINKGLVNFYRELVNHSTSHCVIGVIGLFCSTVTNVIAPIAGHTNIGYIQLAGSTSPLHRRNDTYLFHSIASSTVFNEVVIAMMEVFDWQRIGLVHDSQGFYFRSTANDFIDKIKSISDVEVVTHVPITNSAGIIPETFKIINEQETRISYWSVTVEQSSNILCEAYKKEFLWPGHVYIFHERTVEEILHTNTPCSFGELSSAIEGIFLLQYRLFVENDTKLFSGWTYREYRQMYTNRLRDFMSNTVSHRNDTEEGNVYANSLYDQVWAFALALNNSLPSIMSQNLFTEDNNFRNTKAISKLLKSELTKVSFQGASGRIEFDTSQDIPSFIDIFQVVNGKPNLVGVYDPFIKNITNLSIVGDIPDDRFETIYELLPFWLGSLILSAQCLLFCLITTNVVLLLRWRKESEIKATSLTLSMLIMVGCHLLCVAPIVLTVYKVIAIQNKTIFLSLCNLKIWSTNFGIDLIFATLFVRLLRVFHIFHTFKKTSKYWSDNYLVIYTLLICMGKVALLILWSAVDLIHPQTDQEYIATAIPPYYRTTLYCTSDTLGVWVLLSFLYSGVLLLLVMFLAIQTRHIKKSTFKDTKKVITFIFLITINLATTIPLWILFNEVDVEIGALVFEWVAYFTVVILCQLCLFAPKTLPLAVRKVKFGSVVALNNSVQYS